MFTSRGLLSKNATVNGSRSCHSITRQNSITRTILDKWVPLPNTGGIFNWISTNPQKLDVDQFDWRIDHRISEKDSSGGGQLVPYNVSSRAGRAGSDLIFPCYAEKQIRI